MCQRLCQCDMIYFSETWLKPDELHMISDTLSLCPSLEGTYLSIFSKCMQDVDLEYTGWSLGGVSIVCTQMSDLHFREVCCQSESVGAVSIHNAMGILFK